MPVHFSDDEMSARKQRLLAAMAARGLDGMLLFAQESLFWLTGYDTFGFCFFQCLYVGADGRIALLTRSADLRQAQHTSNIADIRIWKDGADANPASDLRGDARRPRRARPARRRKRQLRPDPFQRPAAGGARSTASRRSSTPRASSPSCRVTKSAAEIAFVREAARLSDLADRAAIERTAAGRRRRRDPRRDA